MFFQVSHGYADGIGDIGLGTGLFETPLVRLQVGKMQEVLGTDVLEQDVVLVIIKKDLKILGAADPVMVIAFGADEQAFPQFRDRTYIIAIRAFCPKPFRSFFFFSRAGQDAFFDALEPTGLAFLGLSIVPRQVRFKIIFLLHADIKLW
jgi:hypothetical protein